jgi:beta-glucosidase/6-phospho-beta-glucosidase/beta-galactosidase
VREATGLDVWGGVECSIVRVADATRNQLADTGHLTRPGDIDLIAGIGLKTVRYPVLWEMVEAERGRYDWTWTDERLGKLHEYGISPIAGLVHHGSGPVWTDLLDPGFPQQLAEYAGRVAERYPWINMYTPVNEPFTTARICGLYGLWHPHGCDEATCFRITVTECRAIALAMKAIRRVNPKARLVQTEDFGRVYATPKLRYQATYENARRWLATDLLTGRVGRDHKFYDRLIEAGVSPGHLAELASDPCPPDIIGIDYYLTSDRVIDHRTELYPHENIGGNGRISYVDIAAVRSDLPKEKIGLASRIEEVWQRYKLPIAVTELHNGCTRDEQLRWFMEGWEVACNLRKRGVDLRAVTSWSLFGACDWNSMITRQDGYYEAGAFDSRYAPPEPTIVAAAIKSMAETGSYDHPALDRPGWWKTEDTPHHGARFLVLSKFERMTSAIEECCHRRRLSVLPAGSMSSSSEIFERHAAWAVLRVERLGQGKRNRETVFRIHCDFVHGGRMTLELPSWTEPHVFADTILDLLVDMRTGALRCIAKPVSTVMNALVEVSGDYGAAAKNSAA